MIGPLEGLLERSCGEGPQRLLIGLGSPRGAASGLVRLRLTAASFSPPDVCRIVAGRSYHSPEACSNHPRKDKTILLLTTDLSPTSVSPSPSYPALTLTRAHARPSSSKKLLLPMLPLLLSRQMLIALNLSRRDYCLGFELTLADRKTPPPTVASSSAALQPGLPRSRHPAPRPRNELSLSIFPGPTPDVRKGAWQLGTATSTL
ncbi:hypothetical protein GWK47_040350 [Chionoecetes opilio]|uniref:Uncharacterized protein n=1 Tax=Chionoecetes opilio TaxID=41210 RepID=A0A8J4YJU6_CHIOP|nr:hypothetical protein GWK47_040350 [Chionoecetes opilio]